MIKTIYKNKLMILVKRIALNSKVMKYFKILNKSLGEFSKKYISKAIT